MADVEKRKSFADMKLVDFTSGFSNFEVGRKLFFSLTVRACPFPVENQSTHPGKPGIL